jgi:methionyl-tRNA formyltransferase
MTALRITYVGLPLGALALAAAGFPPLAICLGHSDAPGARRVRRRLGAGALVLSRPNLADPGVQRALASTEPDLLLSWFWPKRIPEAVLDLAARGAYGVHPSLLPRWRGPDPYFWAIRSGDPETGVSLHQLLPEYDTGGVLQQERLAIDPAENAWSLARRLDRLGLPLLVEAARRLSLRQPWPAVAQDPQRVTLAPRPDDEALAIDWSQPADEILRLVRAAAPYPGASAELGSASVELLSARLVPGGLPDALEPAEAVLIGGEVAVQTGRGGLLLEHVRDAHGNALHGSAIQALFPGGMSVLGSASGRASGKNMA